MRYIDFKYGENFLSDYDFIICDFDFDNSAKDLDIGSEISFNKVSHHSGQKFTLVSASFENCISASFDICKNPDLYNGDEMFVTHEESRDILRWLNKRSFDRFSFCDEDGTSEVFYNASFNVKKITINDKLVGFRLEMETDSPFAYKEITNEYVCSGEDDVKTINDLSEDIGYTFPTIKITCLESGNLSLVNSTNSETTYIKNVTNGEVITIDSMFQTITSNLNGHKIFNDFNFVFFHIGNTEESTSTEFYATLNCKIEILYYPKIKDTL